MTVGRESLGSSQQKCFSACVMRCALSALLYALLPRRRAATGESSANRFFGKQVPASFYSSRIEAFRQGLRELGYVEGKILPLSTGLRREKKIVCVS